MGYKVVYVNYGIANRFPGKYIEMHRKLLNPFYLPLHDEILAHEMAHTDSGYSMRDFKLDFAGFKNKSLYRIFILSTPSSWVQFSPIYKSRKKWYVDLSLMLVWGAVIVALLGAYLWIRI